jgi:hypothetical protein
VGGVAEDASRSDGIDVDRCRRHAIQTEGWRRSVRPGRCRRVGRALPRRRFSSQIERREVPAIWDGRDASLTASDSTPRRSVAGAPDAFARRTGAAVAAVFRRHLPAHRHPFF